MITRRPAAERGHANHGWLDSYHTFSFADYSDPAHMGFRALRVINEDRVQPGKGFGTHGHRNVEIFTWVLAGALEHRDDMGNGTVIHPGEIQHMTAGTGVMHSEFNPSAAEIVHFLQIWILPDERHLKPAWEQRAFAAKDLSDRLCLVASRDSRDGSVVVHQDVDLFIGRLAPATKVEHALRPGRAAWLQVARGAVDLNGVMLAAGDGAAVTDEGEVRVTALRDSEVLLFDLA